MRPMHCTTGWLCTMTLAGCLTAPDGDPNAPPRVGVLEQAATAGGSPQSATGDAHILIFGGTTPERFSFSAVKRPNGTVAGQFELFSEQSGGIRVHGAVTC